MKKMICVIGVCIGIILTSGCATKEKEDISSDESMEVTSFLETDSYETIAESELEETDVAEVETSEEDDEVIMEVTSDDDFRWDKEYLAENYLKELSDEELRILRNEFYARHGCSFVSDDLQAYFSAQPWYHPLSDTMATTFDSSLFNNYEKENLILIEKVEVEREQGSIASEMMEDDELSAVVDEFTNKGYSAEYGDNGLHIRDANGVTVAMYDYWSGEWTVYESERTPRDSEEFWNRLENDSPEEFDNWVNSDDFRDWAYDVSLQNRIQAFENSGFTVYNDNGTLKCDTGVGILTYSADQYIWFGVVEVYHYESGTYTTDEIMIRNATLLNPEYYRYADGRDDAGVGSTNPQTMPLTGETYNVKNYGRIGSTLYNENLYFLEAMGLENFEGFYIYD